MAQSIALQNFRAFAEIRAVQSAVVTADGGRGRHGEVGVAVGDGWVVVAKYVVLQIGIANGRANWAWSLLIQSMSYSL